MPYASAQPSSSISFSQERGPGAFTPLGSLPRRAPNRQRKSLFHIPDDDNTPGSPPQNSPPDTPPEFVDQEEHPHPQIPFPSSDPSSPRVLRPRSSSTRAPSPPRISRTSSSPIVLSNGRTLKSSLKSSSSSSIPDDWAAENINRALHTRAQSMPSTPAFGVAKNVHFKEDDRIATVRIFRAHGRPRSVSTNEDTETETEPEQPAAFPFPALASRGATTSPLAPVMEIDPSPTRTSPIPNPNLSLYSNIHFENVSLPPSRPPVLRGSILVRNVSYEKRVGVRFTLDDWTTVSEVLAVYSTSLSGPHPFLPNSALTVGDLVAPPSAGSSAAPITNQWDRFTFSIRLEDYEARLADRTLLLAASFTAPGTGEWWDNNAGANYRIAFRARAPPPQPSRKPTIASFLSGTTAPPPPPPAAPRSFSPLPIAARPAPLTRSTSTPVPPTMRSLGRLALKHYAAPAPPAVSATAPPPSADDSPLTSPLKLVGGQFATHIDEAEVGANPPPKVEEQQEERHVDEGFETGSEDEDDKAKPVSQSDETATTRRANDLTLKIDAPAPRRPSPVSLSSRGPFSPTRSSPVPFASVISNVAQSNTNPAARVKAGMEPRGDASYAALIREWCFAQGDVNAPASSPAGWSTPGKQNTLWVGMGG